MNAPPPPPLARDRAAPVPYGGNHFAVRWTGAGAAPPLGFLQVLLPPLPVAADKPATVSLRDTAFPPAGHLVLRRAFDGQLELQQWWQRVRSGRLRAPRTVTVQLLDAQHDEPVLQWRFRGARPVSLAWSPLDAMAPALLIETLLLSFEQADIL